jgi:hypothetical protein
MQPSKTTQQPASPPVTQDQSSRDQRREERRQISIVVNKIQRSRAIFDAQGQDFQSCKILDASDNGFRIALLQPHNLTAGCEFVLEHEDGWRRHVRARWVSGQEIGVLIIGVKTFVILTEPKEEVLPCNILSISENAYRITLTPARKLNGEFTLELANGSRRRVRMRWAFDDELGLQIVENKNRLR